MTSSQIYRPPAAFAQWQQGRPARTGAPTGAEPATDLIPAVRTAPLPVIDPPRPRARPRVRRHASRVARARTVLIAVAAPALLAAAVLLPRLAGSASPTDVGSGLSPAGGITLAVFGLAVVAWTFTRWADTWIGLAAVVSLAVTGVIAPEAVFTILAGELIWLLIAAFVLAHAVTTTGLPALVAVRLAARATTPRSLAHRLGAALLLSALVIPSTSGRAALARPIHQALAGVLGDRVPVVRALSLLCPVVILLSAVATLTGAGAHLITDQLLVALTGSGIGFGWWLLLGLPLALVSSVVGVEVVLHQVIDRHRRRQPLQVDRDRLAAAADLPRAAIDAPFRSVLSRPQRSVLLLLGLVVVVWSAEPWHGLSTAFTALVAALVVTVPRLGLTSAPAALSAVPWTLLLFVGCTALLGTALADTGAAAHLGALALGGVGGYALLVVVVVVSAAAHLVLQSRSARSSVLVPLVVGAALATGMNPAALALASTAAAGFCLTLPSSAKPVALFADIDGTPGFDRRDLLRLSAVLGPLTVALVLLFALAVWPLLGLPLVR